MSVVEDSRKVLQDFLAPELRSIAVRIEALEKTVTDNERRAERRHSEIMSAFDKASEYSLIRERLARLEAKNETGQEPSPGKSQHSAA